MAQLATTLHVLLRVLPDVDHAALAVLLTEHRDATEVAHAARHAFGGVCPAAYQAAGDQETRREVGDARLEATRAALESSGFGDLLTP